MIRPVNIQTVQIATQKKLSMNRINMKKRKQRRDKIIIETMMWKKRHQEQEMLKKNGLCKHIESNTERIETKTELQLY